MVMTTTVPLQVEDKFQEELSADKAKYDRLMSDKVDMETAYDVRISSFEVRQAKEVSRGSVVALLSRGVAILMPLGRLNVVRSDGIGVPHVPMSVCHTDGSLPPFVCLCVGAWCSWRI